MKLFYLFILSFIFVTSLCYSVPGEIRYQGKIEVDGIPYDGQGEFKFAIINSTEDTYYWTSDGSSPTPPDPPVNSFSFEANNGLIDVTLGSSPMSPIESEVFENQDTWLRIWFNDKNHGFQRIIPDRKLTSVPYALVSQSLPDNSITGEKFARESVWPEHEGRNSSTISFYATYKQLDSIKVYTVPEDKTLIITDVVFGSREDDFLISGVKISYTKDATNNNLFGGINIMNTEGGYQPTEVNFHAGMPVPGGADLYINGVNNNFTNQQECELTGYLF